MKVTSEISEEVFIKDLLSKMTIEEKIGQMNQVGTSIYGGKEEHYEQLVRTSSVGSFLSIKEIEKANSLQHIAVNETRLGIPLLFAEDVVHGFLTTFPIPLAESCTWNTELLKRSAEIAAEEASAAGIHWTFAPMIDVSRDARWGRVAESFGEDPYLTSEFGAAKVTGFQGPDTDGRIDPNHLLACAKHFVGYSEAEAGRDYNTADISWYKLANIYLPPFKRLIDEKVLSIMSSFNLLNGIPATTNKTLLVTTLREKLFFSGLLISDWNALKETITHGFSRDYEDAVKKAIDCQLDVDMSSLLYITSLKELVEQHIVDEILLDKAVYRVLSLKFRLGLFDNPYRSSTDNYNNIIKRRDEFRKTALQIAEESIVLLKNEQLLPLKKEDRVGYAGIFLDDQESMLDTWSCMGDASEITSIAKAVSTKNNKNYFLLPDAYSEFEKTKTLGSQTNKQLTQLDKIVLVLGEKATDSGEAKSKAMLSLDETQIKFIKAISAINPNIIVVLMNGRPLVLADILPHTKSLVEAWHLGCEAGTAILNILEGTVNPAGKLTMTFPRHEGQLPIYYSHYRTGRPYQIDKFNTTRYIDLSNEPEFPFGFGLSYTSFLIDNLTVNHLKKNHWCVSVDVTNTGSTAGQEVVQLYIGAHYGTYARPIKELKNFKKIQLNSQEKKTVRFQINRDTFIYYDELLNQIFDAGDYSIMIGNSSRIEPKNSLRIEVEK
ncbi:beta-glucosidase [Enterococcus sp. AZ194]|uniref:glycoside hydrolase family 3 N-terminal domain-containing protein n=1 Tax=Enterococcus sp. AZ194 TaxID=2774629 RepID=UPI003F25E62F